MTDILAGIRVVEVSEHGMVPAAGAVLADWGADVVKVNHPVRGDASRGIWAFGVPPMVDGFYGLWEPLNRGKRSVGLDLSSETGHAVLGELLAGADVFLTNMLATTRQKLHIEPEDVREFSPSIIYARGGSYGIHGEEGGRGGFDGSAYWGRSGAGEQLSTDLADPRGFTGLPGPAFGDSQTGFALAGGIAAALFKRERSGVAVTVDTSLFAMGTWAMQASLVLSNLSKQEQLHPLDRTAANNPVNNSYRTKDGRLLALAMMQGDRYWGRLCVLVGRPELADDPRFADIHARTANNLVCIEILEEIFAARTMKEWAELLDSDNIPWTPIQRVTDLNDDPQARANGFIQDVDYGAGRQITFASSPIQFDTAAPTLRPAPELYAHTEEVLLEHGFDWDRIATLKDQGVIA